MLAVLIATALTSVIATSVQAATAVFDNAIQDEPEVECGQGTIAVRVRTASQKPSYIFAKGHFHKNGCHFKQTNNATFHFEQCNINRKREVNPRGMAYSLTVIVQLHPLFITKVDRAYNVRCFYMEDNKEVDAALRVSDLTTSILESGHAMPQCSYTLHRDSPNGPVLRYARVGDVVFHVWDCPSDVYAMLIHTCFILDGQGGEHKVIDEKGCSTDDFIIPQPKYSNELTRSFTGASVVNLPDRESIYFSCQVKLCFKKGDYCTNVTPPVCKERSVENNIDSELVKTKHIEDDLQNDQLLYTTTGPLATSKTIRIISTAAPTVPASTRNSLLENFSPTRLPIHGVTINITDRSDMKLSTLRSTMDITNSFSNSPKFMDFLEKQNINLTDLMQDIEGSGEDEYVMSTFAMNVTSTTASADYTSADTTKYTNNLPTATTQTNAKGAIHTSISPSRQNAHLTTQIRNSSTTMEPNPTRGRRTIAEDDYNIVDIDVTTPQLKILEEGFDLPDPSIKANSLSGNPEGGVCIPALNLWILVGVSLISVSIAVATVTYFKLSSRKIMLLDRY